MTTKVDFIKTIALKTLIALFALFLVFSFMACSDGNERGGGSDSGSGGSGDSGGGTGVVTWVLDLNSSSYIKFYPGEKVEVNPPPQQTGTGSLTLVYRGNPTASGTVRIVIKEGEGSMPDVMSFTVTASNGTVTAVEKNTRAKYTMQTSGSGSGGSSGSGGGSSTNYSGWPEPKEEKIGGNNSGFTVYKLFGDSLPGSYSSSPTRISKNNVNHYLPKYETYVKGLIKEFSDSLSNNAKSYFDTYLNSINNITYDADNLDLIIEKIYNRSSYIFADMIQAILTAVSYNESTGLEELSYESRYKLFYTFELLSNEAYRKGFPSHDYSYYNYENIKNNAINYLERNCGLSDLANDISYDDCRKIASALNQMLETAAQGLNSRKNLNVTAEQLRQLINIVMTAKSLACIHDATQIHGRNCELVLKLDDAMENAIRGTGTTMTGYIGTKSPSSSKAVGDIVFSDGSATPYTRGLKLDHEQKASAVAVIFYTGSSLGYNYRTLGVGLAQGNSAWCKSSAEAYNENINSIQCSSSGSEDLYFSGDMDGSDNLEQMASYGIGDTTGNGAADKYPAFYFAKNYKDKTGSHVSGTDYETGWYLPTVAELYQIYKCMHNDSGSVDINAAVQLCGGAEFKQGSYYYEYYWSSSQGNYASVASTFSFRNGTCSYSNKGNGDYYVIAIREF